MPIKIGEIEIVYDLSPEFLNQRGLVRGRDLSVAHESLVCCYLCRGNCLRTPRDGSWNTYLHFTNNIDFLAHKAIQEIVLYFLKLRRTEIP